MFGSSLLILWLGKENSSLGSKSETEEQRISSGQADAAQTRWRTDTQPARLQPKLRSRDGSEREKMVAAIYSDPST